MSRSGSSSQHPPDRAPIWARLPAPRRRASRVLLIGPLVMLVLIVLAFATHSPSSNSLRVATVGSSGRALTGQPFTAPTGTLQIDASTATATACVLLGTEPIVLPSGWGIRTDPLRIVDWSGRTRGTAGEAFTGSAHQQSGQVAFCPSAGKYLVVDDFEAAAAP